ncbi:MAG: hypothetical protein LBD73_01425 [Deferribacteraceae bacterium]|jgi:type II secretory pathway component PulM|nr:hypothetical protein [Deferribacteraceae bacterium]
MINDLKRYRQLFKDFHFRQQFMTALLVALAVVFIFYGTFVLFGESVQASIKNAEQLQERVTNVKSSIAKIEKNTAQTKTLSTGLLTYVQGLSGQLTGGGKFTNIKIINATTRQEQVSFKTENLVYNDFVNLLKEFENYGNVQIKSLSVNKRFDNPKRIDALWDIVRAEQ